MCVVCAQIIRNTTSGAALGVVGTSTGFGADRSEPCTDQCEVAGYSVPAAHTLAASVSASASPMAESAVLGGTDMDGVKAGIAQVYSAVTSNANGYEVSVYFAYSASQTFYLVKSCWAAENQADPYCQRSAATVQFVACTWDVCVCVCVRQGAGVRMRWLCGHMVCCGATDARNAEAFGDNRRRVWALTATGGLMNEGSPWITSSEYFPSQRSWCVGV